MYFGGLDYTVKLKTQREGAIWNLLKSALSAWAVWATNMQKNLAASIPGCVLHAICNVDTSRLRAVAEELGVPHTYTDFAAMCADPELDGIVIVSPSFFMWSRSNCHGARQARFL